MAMDLLLLMDVDAKMDLFGSTVLGNVTALQDSLISEIAAEIVQQLLFQLEQLLLDVKHAV